MLARLPVSSAGPRLVLCHRHIRRPIVRVVAFHATRTYATPGRPKSVVGEPSKPVKRATTRAARASKPSAKKTTAEKAKSTKTATKKAAPKKAAPKKKPKKVTLTEEQKAAQKAKLLKRKTSEKKKADLLEIKTLKEQALAPPVSPAAANRSAYNVYLAEAMKGTRGDVTGTFAETAKKYKSLSATEKETYQKRANELEAERATAIKKWIESHSAAEIGAANKARSRLNRLYPTGKGSRAKYPLFPDERLPKKPLSAWTIYYGEHAGGALGSATVKERINAILGEFKQLSSAERSVYDRKSQDTRREYERVYQEVYGKAPASPEASIA